MRAYLRLLRVPGLPRVIVSQLLARLPVGMLTIAVLLHVQQVTHSYASGGLAVACLSIGEAACMPVTSRLVGRFGLRPTISVAAAVNVVGLLFVAFGPAQLVALCIGSLLTGASVPPLMSVVRALYPRLVAAGDVSVLFALDTTAQEVIWIVGPMLATLAATLASPTLALALAAAATGGGTLAFLTAPAIQGITLPRDSSRFGGVLVERVLRSPLIASLALVASFTALQIAVLSRFPDDALQAGIPIALSSLGSLIGGLLFGHRRIGRAGLTGLLLITTVATAAAAFAPGVVAPDVLIFFSGFGFAPSLSTLYAAISRTLDERRAPEAFGWLTTASLLGAAAGSAIAGIVGDAHGPIGVFIVSAAFALLAMLAPITPGLGLTRAHLADQTPL